MSILYYCAMSEEFDISLDILQKRTITTPEKVHLWYRFSRIQQAVYKSLTDEKLSNGNRKLNTFDWSGEDSGIHDHKGNIKTVVNGIKLGLLIEGSTYDYRRGKENYLSIFGIFTSRDNREGLVNIVLHNSPAGVFDGYEAYWLDYLKDKYRLEQVSNLKGETFNVPEIPEEKYHPNKYLIYTKSEISGVPLTRIIEKHPDVRYLRKIALD